MLFLVSCENFFIPQHSSIPPGKGAFSLRLSDIQGRTILPREITVNNFVIYTLTFTPAGVGDVVLVDLLPAELGLPVYLDVGSYTLLVTAYYDVEKTQTAATGEITTQFQIAEGENTSESVVLKITSFGTGTGSLGWDIRYSGDINEIKMTIIPYNQVAGSEEIELILVGTSANSTPFDTIEDIPVGYYSVVFTITKQGSQTIEYKEIMHIYQGMQSYYEFEFTNDHFNRGLYTVTYVFDDDETQTMQETRFHGAVANEPLPPVKTFIPFAALYRGGIPTRHTLSGWHDGTKTWDFHTDTVTGNITLTAQWIVPALVSHETVPPNDIVSAVNYIAGFWSSFTLLLDSNIPPINQSLTLANDRGLDIRVMDNAATITLQFEDGYNFTVEGARLTLSDKVTISGSTSEKPLVNVKNGSTFNMNGNSTITRNINSSAIYNFAAVYVENDSYFNMHGTSSITGNTNSNAGSYNAAVHVENNSSLQMFGSSKITGNSMRDVYINVDNMWVSSLIISNDSEIGNLLLSTITASTSAAIGINTWFGWTGNITNIDLAVNDIEAASAADFWTDRPVVRNDDGSDISTVNINKFNAALRDFVDTTGASLPISDTHFIATDGILRAKPAETVFVTVDSQTPSNGFNTLAAALDFVNSTTGTSFIVELNDHHSIGPRTITKNVTLKALNTANQFNIDLTSNGHMFDVDNGGTLTLGTGVILNGHDNNSVALVNVKTGGSLIMQEGSIIQDNICDDKDGGGVYIDGGTFLMNGGQIRRNEANEGSGVFILLGTAIINGGMIIDNKALFGGGGIFVSGGILTLGGTAVIKENIALYGSNVYLTIGCYITLGTGSDGAAAPAEGMEVHVHTGDDFGVIVSSGANVRNGKYFHADEAGMTVVFYGDDTALCIITDPNIGRTGLTADDPFHVHDLLTLYRVGRETTGWTLGAHYLLTRNFTLNDLVAPRIDDSNWVPIGNAYPDSFIGSLDGGNFAINGLIISGRANAGLFHSLQSTSKIQKLRLENVHFNGTGNNTGGLAGSGGGLVDNIFISGTVSSTGNYVGGLFGGSGSTTITNSQFSGDVGSVVGTNQIGGLIGNVTGVVEVKDSFVYGSVKGNTSIGGIAGSVSTGGIPASGSKITIENSQTFASVSGNNNVGGMVGGIINSESENTNGGTVIINKSIVSGNITGTSSSIGGMVGYGNDRSTITINNCYTTGNVSGPGFVGGIAGNIENIATITYSYTTGNISGNSNIGGIVGFNNSSNSRIENCVALNEAIIRSNGGAELFGRIAGSNAGTLSGNRARSDMIVINNIIEDVPPGTAGATTKHGLSISVWNAELFMNEWGFGDDWWTVDKFPSHTLTHNTGFSIELKGLDEWEDMVPQSMTFDLLVNPGFLPFNFSLAPAYQESGYTYQWYLDGDELIGVTSSQYMFNVSSEKPAGLFELVVLVTRISDGEKRSGRVNITVLR